VYSCAGLKNRVQSFPSPAQSSEGAAERDCKQKATASYTIQLLHERASRLRELVPEAGLSLSLSLSSSLTHSLSLARARASALSLHIFFLSLPHSDSLSPCQSRSPGGFAGVLMAREYTKEMLFRFRL